jgi:hypothetical protein
MSRAAERPLRASESTNAHSAVAYDLRARVIEAVEMGHRGVKRVEKALLRWKSRRVRGAGPSSDYRAAGPDFVGDRWRVAADRFEVSVSSAVKWMQRWHESGKRAAL